MHAAPKHFKWAFPGAWTRKPQMQNRVFTENISHIPSSPSFPSKTYRIPMKEGHSWKYFKPSTFSTGKKIPHGLPALAFFVFWEILSNQWTLLMNRYSYTFLILLRRPVPVKSYDISMVSYGIEKHHQVCINFAVDGKTVPEWGHGSPLNSVNS